MGSLRHAAADLARRLLAALKAQRALGDGAYPTTLRRLAELADPQATPEQVKAAAGSMPFKDGAVLASSRTRDPESLVALAPDLEQLAGDPRLLESVLARLCTPEQPLWPLHKVKARIENARLRSAFEQAVERRVRDDALPPGVGARVEKNKPHLYLKMLPPRDPEEALAEKLLQVLDAQRRLGGDSYPLPLQRLVALTAPQTKPALLAKALARPAVRERLLLLDPKNQHLPVAFAEDGNRLYSDAALLDRLIRKQWKPNNNVVALDKLLPKKSGHYPALHDAVSRQIDADALPRTIGWLWAGKKKLLFFLEDVRRGGGGTDGKASVPAPEAALLAETPAEFARAFDEAFNRLDREKGGHNFVSLVDLRRALPTAPDAFNTELRKLRMAGRYTLSGAEGRHGLTPEERQAGVVEDGSLLLYVSRKNP